jgi:hypothetical protein
LSAAGNPIRLRPEILAASVCISRIPPFEIPEPIHCPSFAVPIHMKPTKRAKYHLQVCPGTNLQGPTDDEIRQALLSLPGGVPSFAILTKSKMHFMQVGGSAHEGFALEYQEFSVDGHWEHELRPDVDLETVTGALIAFANDDDDTWRALPWKRVSIEEIGRRSDQAKEKFLKKLEAEEPASPPNESSIWEDIKGFGVAAVVVALEEMGLKSKPKRK